MDTTIMKQYSNGSNTNSVLRRASQFESRQQDSNNTNALTKQLPSAHHVTKMPTPRSSLKRRVTPTTSVPTSSSNTSINTSSISSSSTSLQMPSTSLSTTSSPPSSSSLPRNTPSNTPSSNSPVSSTAVQSTVSTSCALQNSSSDSSVPSNFYTVALNRFQSEFSSLYPDDKIPFDVLKSSDDVQKQVKKQQIRINEIQKELSVSKFVLKFLESINSHRENNDIVSTDNSRDILNARDEDVTKESKEQYVTVITLNDSTYGEIQRTKLSSSSLESSPESAKSSQQSSVYSNIITDVASSSMSNDHNNSSGNNNSQAEILQASSNNANCEPIYLNTLESHNKSNLQCTQRKRPPTPPRKPKFGKMQGSSCDISSIAALESTPITKSDSLNSIPKVFQRRFAGPVHQIEISKQFSNNNARKQPLQTFSLEKTSRVAPTILSRKDSLSNTTDTDNDNLNDDEDDEDNIYDTVAPDSEESARRGLHVFEEVINNDIKGEDDDGNLKDFEEDRSLLTENETSSQDLLSRCSSTDEVSNYVNIDYFLRKNSLGRSHSNILGSINSFGAQENGSLRIGGYHKQFSLDPSRFLNENVDTETTMSSMKSSDYDNFSSNENLIDNYLPSQQQQQCQQNPQDINISGGGQLPHSGSLKSLNSLSINESGPKLKLITNSSNIQNADFLPSSYPPPMSTFTPPARDKGQAMFNFKSVNRLEAEKVSPYCVSPCSDPNLSAISQNSTPEKSTDDSAQYYAYTDLIDPHQQHETSSNSGMLSDKTDIHANDESFNDFDMTTSTFGFDQSANASFISKDEIDQCQQMQWNIIQSIIQSETAYLDCLKTLDQYEKALKTTLKSGKENCLISSEDLKTIFYKIGDLKELHTKFSNGLKVVEHGYKLRHSSMTSESILSNKLMNKQSVGELFFNLASNLSIYSDFLRNYSLALETANRCIANNKTFSDIVKQIKIASLKGQFTTLIHLLHEPIARLQKNAMVIHDLLKYVDPRNEEEKNYLEKALKLTQTFLAELNLDLSKKLLPPIQEKFQRRLVKDSFIIDNCNDRRKLRHLFLFNDVIVCAKYKASTKQKYTFEVKWFQMLSELVFDNVHDSQKNGSGSSLRNITFNSSSSGTDNLSRSASLNSRDRDQLHFDHVDQIKLRTFVMRYEMLMEEQKRKGNAKVSEKFKKKLSELESELVLYLPNLRFSFHSKSHPNRPYVFLMSSEFERESWYDTITRMQHSHLTNTEHPSLSELQRWVDTCRRSMNPNLGSFLLRTHKDESLCFGDLYFRIIHFGGLDPAQVQNIFFVIETDSYGHYFKHAHTKYVEIEKENFNINQEFLVELEGSQNLRILCYEDVVRTTACDPSHDVPDAELVDKSTIIRGKAVLDLNCLTLSSQFQRQEIIIFEHTLVVEMCFRSWNEIMSQFPANKICGTFGLSIEQVCKKEKSKIPYLILSCITEVERRGLREVGIYRISGLASDIQKLKKAFEMTPREAMWLIRGIDIHAVTGMFKLYLRELAESMVPKEMYMAFKEIRDIRDLDQRDAVMRRLLEQLPEPNQTTVRMMIDHLARVNRYEEYNKMSLQNLATIFGPTMLKTAPSSGKDSKTSGSNYNLQSNSNSAGISNQQMLINSDLFTASTIDVLAQAEILYCFINQKAKDFAHTSSLTAATSESEHYEHEQTSL